MKEIQELQSLIVEAWRKTEQGSDIENILDGCIDLASEVEAKIKKADALFKEIIELHNDSIQED